MGFFNFKKKEQGVSTPTTPDFQKVTVTEPSPEEETLIAVTPPLPEEMPKPTRIDTIGKKEVKTEKEDINDFFSLDIYDVFQYEPKHVGKDKGVYGNPVELFSLQLPELQLSTFHAVKILRYSNGHYDLVFDSATSEINDVLRELVDFCSNTFGVDFMRKGSINDKDLCDARLGAFSRIWHESVRLENPSFKMALTLYDITPVTSL